MKLTVNIIRILVGLLFIFSGLVKANDPLGLSYKMQEFFELWGMTDLNRFTLVLSVSMIAFEIIAGFALLLGWKMRFFSWMLLLLMLFFTFLTGYAHLSGKFKNCGCFGDCFPISAKTSFIKDIILLILVGVLFAFRRHIRPFLSNRAGALAMLVVTILSIGMQLYVLKHLPFVDCLPFSRQKNIVEQMKMPANAIPDSTVILFRYTKNGKEVEFTADNFPSDFDSTYTNMRRTDKLIRKGKNNEPPIKGFVLRNRDNVDSTEYVLNEPVAALLFIEHFRNDKEVLNDIKTLHQTLTSKNIRLYIISSNVAEAEQTVNAANLQGVPVYTIDFTALRTAARADPTLYLLNKGTIVNKWSYADLDKAIAVIEKN